MTSWLLLNTAGLLILSAVVFLMLRQIGFLLQRSGVVGARATAEGPRIGESIVSHFPPAGIPNGKAKLLVFLSDYCVVCKMVRAGAEPLARQWSQHADIYLIYDCASEAETTDLQQIAPSLYLKRDFSLRNRLGANFVPFSTVTDTTGSVVNKALVNEISHLESLLEAEQAHRKTATIHHDVAAQPSLDTESVA